MLTKKQQAMSDSPDIDWDIDSSSDEISLDQSNRDFMSIDGPIAHNNSSRNDTNIWDGDFADIMEQIHIPDTINKVQHGIEYHTGLIKDFARSIKELKSILLEIPTTKLDTCYTKNVREALLLIIVSSDCDTPDKFFSTPILTRFLNLGEHTKHTEQLLTEVQSDGCFDSHGRLESHGRMESDSLGRRLSINTDTLTNLRQKVLEIEANLRHEVDRVLCS
ncbi:hypothetical protein NADFUDRAFT_78334 [Nadsonia fulvescens var. elongata DSM 6958]|uniref:Uncharacterized protein n=1 Tax=Nadsonia fulvescens var. elongata DSM 6958 TaxID=857566 RepID=A0A1E3PJK7_9ASCO|nr:hypothetical protein NADFUDRAFT_78334 [Nadsonia fulvescens var. elongata DSM 6958]